MFGEILGIWVMNFMKKVHENKKFNLIEIGGGRGTLICDILRVFS